MRDLNGLLCTFCRQDALSAGREPAETLRESADAISCSACGRQLSSVYNSRSQTLQRVEQVPTIAAEDGE